MIFLGFGLPDLGVSWDRDWPVMLEAGWGLLFTVLVGAACVRVAVRLQRAAPAIVQLLEVAAVLAVSAGLVACYLGVVSAAWPGTPGGYALVRSVLTIVWGLAVAAFAIRDGRR